MLDAASILSAPDLKPTPVEVPEWGGVVYVRAMTGAERGPHEAESMTDKAGHVAGIRQRMAVRCLCDKDGKRLFRDDQAEDLGKKSSAALDRILAAITKANALGEEGVTEAGKSSTGDTSAGSGSDSP